MQLKTAAKIAIVCLSLSALMSLTSDIWTHRLIVIGAFTEMRTLYRIVLAIQILLFHLPLIYFSLLCFRENFLQTASANHRMFESCRVQNFPQFRLLS